MNSFKARTFIRIWRYHTGEIPHTPPQIVLLRVVMPLPPSTMISGKCLALRNPILYRNQGRNLRRRDAGCPRRSRNGGLGRCLWFRVMGMVRPVSVLSGTSPSCSFANKSCSISIVKTGSLTFPNCTLSPFFKTTSTSSPTMTSFT